MGRVADADSSACRAAELKHGDPKAALAAANAAREEAPAHTGDVVPISNDDYYSKNPEFAVWLRDTRNIFFR
jgi:hypothetical protein